MAHVCETCSKSFTQLRSLTRHQKSAHSSKRFVCQHCNEQFTRKDALKRHERKHLEDAIHTCANCLRAFYRNDMLVEYQIFCLNTYKRKLEEIGEIPAAKKPRVCEQTGAGEAEKPQADDDDPCNLTTAFKDSLKKVELKSRKDQKHDMSQFLRGKSKPILHHLSKELKEKRGLKWFISVKVRFVKPKPNGEDLIAEPHFRSLCITTVNPHELESQLQEANQKVVSSLAIYQKEGSGWVLEEILHLDLSMAQYTPLKGSSYIPFPKKLSNKKAIINIKNSDNKCFMWSVLAALHQPSRDPERLHHYRDFKDELNFDGIEFPVAIDKVSKFERQNNISINIIGFEDVLFPLYITKERFDTHVNLLLYSHGTTRHYCLIKDLNKLLYAQNRYKVIAYMDLFEKIYYKTTNLTAVNMVHNA